MHSGTTRGFYARWVHAEQADTPVVGIDSYATEVQLTGGSEWQPVVLAPGDSKDGAGTALTDWSGIRELRLGATETLDTSRA